MEEMERSERLSICYEICIVNSRVEGCCHVPLLMSIGSRRRVFIPGGSAVTAAPLIEIILPRRPSAEELVEALGAVLRENPPPEGVTIGRPEQAGTAPGLDHLLVFNATVGIATGVAANLLTPYVQALGRAIMAKLGGSARLKYRSGE